MNLLHLSPLMALFVVAALGYLGGRVQVRGVSLGVAAVLFAGLLVSAIVPVELPEIVPQLGLAIFIYGIGVASGPGFFALFRRRGLRDAALALAVLIAAALASVLAGSAIGASAATTAGLFAGALTNTPALAAVVQSLGNASTAAEPVVAYSVSYPLGVLGLLGAMLLGARVLRSERGIERPSGLGAGFVDQQLDVFTVRVGAAAAGRSASSLRIEHQLRIAFGRQRRGGTLVVLDEAAPLAEGDVLTVVGERAECVRAAARLGELSNEHLELDRSILDFRRIFVSSREVVERPLAELQLFERFGAVITRIRRGDVELLPDAESELELGDRVRVVAPRARLPEVSKFFGDSFQSLAEIDVLTFGLGVVLGLVLGEIPVPLPGGGTFRLGIAGGPLVVGLLLGRLGRTGPLVWTLPYAAGVTLRQVGLLLFLAGVGLRSGQAFAETLGRGEGLGVLAMGALITFVTAFCTLALAHRVLKLPMEVALGLVAGVHTQPAALAFADEQTGSELPRLGYASVFPVATIAKIVLAQLIVSWLGSP